MSYDLKCSTRKPVRKTAPSQSELAMILPDGHSEGLSKQQPPFKCYIGISVLKWKKKNSTENMNKGCLDNKM